MRDSRFRLAPPQFLQVGLQSIAVRDVCRLCFLERGEKVACGCGDLALSEMFEIGNGRAVLPVLRRPGGHRAAIDRAHEADGGEIARALARNYNAYCEHHGISLRHDDEVYQPSSEL